MKISELQTIVKDALEKFGDVEVVFIGQNVNGTINIVENPCCGIVDCHPQAPSVENLRFFVGFHGHVEIRKPGPGLKVVK